MVLPARADFLWLIKIMILLIVLCSAEIDTAVQAYTAERAEVTRKTGGTAELLAESGYTSFYTLCVGVGVGVSVGVDVGLGVLFLHVHCQSTLNSNT